MAYSYYRGGTPIDPAQRKLNMKHARELAERRLNPSRSDVDDLIFLHRRPVLARWLQMLPDSLDVVDLGGRIQPYRSLLGTKARTYFGVDLQFEGCVDLIASAERLPLASNSLDLVLCTDTLQYVPDAPGAIREMHRVLRPGGKLILSTRGAYPEHHDELWRFLPDGLRYLARMFRSVEVVSEGGSGSGMIVALNVLLHRNISSPLLGRLVARTPIPFLNSVGLLLDRLARNDTRSACGVSLRGTK